MKCRDVSRSDSTYSVEEKDKNKQNFYFHLDGSYLPMNHL